MTIHTVEIAVHSPKGCCTATTMALTSDEQKITSTVFEMSQYKGIANCENKI